MSRDYSQAHRRARAGRPVGQVPRPPEDRFWAQVQKAEGCWMWTGARTKAGCGYGYITVGSRRGHQRQIGAHVFAWELFWGREVPKKLQRVFWGYAILEKCCIMHTCDNPGCVNPHHLMLATRSENIIDSVRKGRHSSIQHQPNPTREINAIRKRIAALGLATALRGSA